MKNPTTIPTNLETTLIAARDHAATVEAASRSERLELERAIKLARGTRDVTAAAGAASAPARIEAALRGGSAPMGVVDLARVARVQPAEARRELARLRATSCPTRSREDAADARMVHNHGTDVEPLWAWVVGDETPTADLATAVEHMITRRPYTFAELTLATGARRGRLSGVLVMFQREGRKIRNLGGTDRQYRWSMSPARR